MTGRSGWDEWREGWGVVLAATVGITIAVTHIYAIGVLLGPIEQTFGWSRTVASSGLTIVSVIAFLAAPFVGFAVDKLGPRRIGLAGLVVFCSGIAALSLASASPWSWWGLWLIVALGNMGVKGTIWTAGVAGRFQVTRGTALAVALCGTGLGAAVLPLLSAQLAQSHGWRGAVIGVGAIELAVALPLVLLFFYGARDLDRRDRRDSKLLKLTGLGVREALLSRRFFQLGGAAFAFAVAAIGTVFHFAPILQEGGLAPTRAAAIAGLIGIATIVGRIITGFLVDRMQATRVGMVVFLIPVLAWIGIMSGQFTGAGPYVVACAVGLAAGAELDLVAYLVTRYFGLRSFGVVFGTISGLLGLAAGVGPLTAAMMFDRFGSYQPVGWIFIPLFVLGSLLVGSLGRYPEFDDEAAVEDASRPLAKGAQVGASGLRSEPSS